MVYLFKNSDNPIDDLIDQLTKAGWKTRLASSGYFTKYKWPNLVFSADRIRYFDLPFDWETEKVNEVLDRRNDNFDNNHKDDFENEIDDDNYDHNEKEFRNCIELMGCYRLKCTNQYKEGEIVIYFEKLYRVALNFCSNHKKWKGVELEHTINHLRDIVMYHEFVHWFMHWVKSASGRYIPHLYNSRDTVMFHEAFAQLFTHLYVQNNPARKELFEWLLTKQPPQYLAHDNLLSAGVDSIKKAIDLLDILRLEKIQGFAATLALLNNPIFELIKTGDKLTLMEAYDKWEYNNKEGIKDVTSEIFGLDPSKFIDEYKVEAIHPLFKRL